MKHLNKLTMLLIALTMSASLFAQNNCLDFDGDNDYINVPGLTTWNSITAFTVEAWIYTTVGNNDMKIVGKTNGDHSDGFSMDVRDNELYLELWLGNSSSPYSTTSTATFNNNEWTHIAMTWESDGNMKGYINGDQVIDVSTASYTLSNTGTLKIGVAPWDASSYNFNGKVDEVRVWDDVRSEAEIRANMYQVLTPGSEGNLVAYYKLNESDGNTTASDSKNSYDGNLTNMTGNEWETSAAFFGPKYCLDFDGTGDDVDCGSINLSGSSITLECWAKPDAFQGSSPYISSLIGTEDPTSPGNNSALLRLGDGDIPGGNKVQFILAFSGIQVKLAGTTELQTGNWYHIAGVYDGAKMKIYVNGVLDAENTQTGSFTSNDKFCIASKNGTERYLDGSIDEVRVWSDARTATEIRDNMCKSLIGNETGLLAYYNCDALVSSVLPDYSGNNHDGTEQADTYATSSSAFNTWLNTTYTYWSEGSNWSRGSAPGSSDNVGIFNYGGSSVSPRSLCSGNFEINHFIISTGATFEPCGDGEASILCDGNFINNGTFSADPPVFYQFGSGNQYIGGSSEISLNVIYVTGATSHDAFLTSDGKLTLASFTINSECTFTIQSSADGTGSLIVSGTPSDNVIFERYVDDIPTKGDPKWHYVSSPVAGQSIENFIDNVNNSIATYNTFKQFFRWDEPTNFWFIYGDGLFIETIFGNAEGYCLTRSASGNLNFTGTVRTSDVEYLTSYTVGFGDGFNLVGNPFTSSLMATTTASEDLNFLTVNTALLDNSYEALYIWDEQPGYSNNRNDYKVISNSGITGYTSINQHYISPGQAFMVKVISGASNYNLAFNENMQAHNNATFYKNKDVWPSVELIVENDELFNSTAIGFNENMTKGLDPSYDVGKLKGNPDIALYTKLIQDNGVDFAIQALPYFEQDYSVKVGLDIANAGEYTFKAATMEQIPENVYVYFEDKLTGTVTNLKETDNYTCVISEAGNITNRFVLHFTSTPFSTDEINANQNNIQIWSANKTINILNPENLKGQIRVINIYGQKLIETRLNGNDRQQVTLNIPTGNYIVNVISDKGVISRKIFIGN